MSLPQQPPSHPFGLANPKSVAVYDSYDDARQAVDYLADRQFTVKELAIVGTDLKSVPQAAATASWGKVVAAGAVSGVMWGLLLAVLLWIFLPGRSLFAMVAWGLLFGVVYGVASQAVQYAMTRDQPDASAPTTVVATRYEVLGESDSYRLARTILDEKPLAWHSATDNTAILPVVRVTTPDMSRSAANPAVSGNQAGSNGGAGSDSGVAPGGVGSLLSSWRPSGWRMPGKAATDRSTDGLGDGQVDGSADEKTNGVTDGATDGVAGGQTGGSTGGVASGSTSEPTGGPTAKEAASGGDGSSTGVSAPADAPGYMAQKTGQFQRASAEDKPDDNAAGAKASARRSL